MLLPPFVNGFLETKPVAEATVVELELDGDGEENVHETKGVAEAKLLVVREKLPGGGQSITLGGGIFKEFGGGTIKDLGGGTVKEPGGNGIFAGEGVEVVDITV